MVLGMAVLLGLSLTSPPAASPAPRAPPVRAAPPSAAPSCTRYRVLAEPNDLVPDAEVTAWVSAALARGALLDPAAPCFVHVRITAGPIRTGGKEDGFVAHVSTSTRRFLRDGKLVTREKGLLLVAPRRDEVVLRAHAFVDDYVAGLATTAILPPAGGGREATSGG